MANYWEPASNDLPKIGKKEQYWQGEGAPAKDAAKKNDDLSWLNGTVSAPFRGPPSASGPGQSTTPPPATTLQSGTVQMPYSTAGVTGGVIASGQISFFSVASGGAGGWTATIQ